MSTGQETTSQDHHNLRDDLHPSGKITGDASYLVHATSTDTSRLISDVHFDMTGIFGLAAPILAWVFEGQSKRDEATLKKLLESTKGDASPAQ